MNMKKGVANWFHSLCPVFVLTFIEIIAKMLVSIFSSAQQNFLWFQLNSYFNFPLFLGEIRVLLMPLQLSQVVSFQTEIPVR